MNGPEDILPEETGPEGTGAQPMRDDPMLAAEWALGLLEGEDLLAARGKYATDPQFAWRKEWWDNWFAPWTDDMAGAAEPGDHVWQGIAGRIAAQAGTEGGGLDAASGGDVIELKVRLRRWQWVAGLTSAAAAVALALLAFAPDNAPVTAPGAVPAQIAAADPMVATVPIGETGLRLDVTWIPASDKMLIAALGLSADGVHDHELWLVPQGGGDALSLGVVAPGEVRSMAVPQDIAAELHNGSRLVLTREPIGGKPEGIDAGPVVAEGAFTRV
ncbi:anti-sigma factor [Erythrobacter sanguineus]|uniref:Anti-sigma-K factor RskA n=1 Tax=Erythrobacter sanguineus TaxID=198312 RepID=A0A1M7RY13_9SPHN|nr:anti-sigma factor [Erythrobacter sanguineus]SHN51203.1 Anti-sigma-K factor RskA [Erythrobacter sanguineus]